MSLATTALDGYSGDERKALETAVRRNCACEFTDSVLTKRCEPCSMLENDARALNGLLFNRRKKSCLFKGEFGKE